MWVWLAVCPDRTTRAPPGAAKGHRRLTLGWGIPRCPGALRGLDEQQILERHGHLEADATIHAHAAQLIRGRRAARAPHEEVADPAYALAALRGLRPAHAARPVLKTRGSGSPGGHWILEW